MDNYKYTVPLLIVLVFFLILWIENAEKGICIFQTRIAESFYFLFYIFEAQRMQRCGEYSFPLLIHLFLQH